jgi:hypothetical protein
MSKQKTHTTETEQSPETQPAAAQYTVEASSHFGQFAYTGSAEVSAEEYAKLANEGFESRLQTASSKLDSHKEFGNFGHKDASGKTVKRSPDYNRGKIQFTPEKAELVRQHLATRTMNDETVVAITTSRYIPSTEKTVSVDTANVVNAKASIARRNDNPTELADLANKVGYSYSATNELTVDNAAFVDACAKYLANVL